MTDKLKQTIKEEMEKLPKETREAINSFDWVRVTEEIGKNFSLNEEELTNFQTETLLVLISLENPDSYAENIENNVHADKEKSKQIAEEAYQKIFMPINNIFIDKIKNSVRNKDSDWQQNLNFVLSGGNYSVFVKTKDDEVNNKNITT